MKAREKSVALVIVVHCIVLEIRPEGLPDGLRVGGGRGGMREREDSKMILLLLA